jgi:hypothetical protein
MLGSILFRSVYINIWQITRANINLFIFNFKAVGENLKMSGCDFYKYLCETDRKPELITWIQVSKTSLLDIYKRYRMLNIPTYCTQLPLHQTHYHLGVTYWVHLQLKYQEIASPMEGMKRKKMFANRIFRRMHGCKKKL